jgi:4-hydroxyproline epimerase
MACLAADGKLKPGQLWRQEGILGTVFEGNFQFEESGIAANRDSQLPLIQPGEQRIIPTITGSAYITAESTLIFDPADPFRLGVPE